MVFKLSILLLVFSQPPFVMCSRPQNHNNRFAEAEALMEKAVSSQLVPSLSVAVSQAGKIVWEKSVGFADIEKEIKATPTTAYSLASVSKPITATGLMVLVERGLVDLEKPANLYLGKSLLHSVVFNAEEATVLRILNHTAGMATHWHFFFADDPYTRPTMEESIRRYGVLTFSPGSQYTYSNLGYGIIDFIIEKVSGRPYPEFMAEEVFKPLGMTHSAVLVEPGPDDLVAQRYMGKGKLIPFYDFDHRGASAVYSSARDLVRFGMFHLKNHLSDQKNIVSDETIDSMHSLHDPGVDSNEYRLGWSRSYLAQHKAISHGGSMPGVTTNLLLLPDLDIALVMLCNANYNGLRPIGQAVLEALIPDLKKELAAYQKTGTKPVSDPKDTPEALLGKWEGKIFTHEGQIPVELVIEKEKKLNFRFTGEKYEDERSRRPISRINMQEDSLNATFYFKVPTPDTARFLHQLNLNLKRDGNNLQGSASAIAVNMRFCLPSFISLTKTE